jgi:steroid delta-isomerase-like uncharacterized protein
MEETMNAQQDDGVVTDLTADHSRRRFVRMFGGGAVGALVAASAQTGAAAQLTSPEALPPILAEWVAGWETLDAERNAAPYAEDAILVAVPTGETVRGREAIRTNMEGLFAAFSDATARMPSVLVAGDRAAVEWTFEGHYTGQILGMPPGTGQPVSFRGVSILELTGGAIRRNTRYFDLFQLLLQTGALPPAAIPGGAATPGS